MQEFATALLDHTRSSYELEVLLNYDPSGPVFEQGDRMLLSRLKLAIKHKQKKAYLEDEELVFDVLATMIEWKMKGIERKKKGIERKWKRIERESRRMPLGAKIRIGIYENIRSSMMESREGGQNKRRKSQRKEEGYRLRAEEESRYIVEE
ncbi:trpgamma [Trichonephila clavata]|uniref:Trpgamma n=1 Tax=Trichonephila clavata TaxID=2740835 RepID=A0A8X6GS43_TRICU|nr:trpgamma [Trichonephila clavata]